jgi:hypothetical protein
MYETFSSCLSWRLFIGRIEKSANPSIHIVVDGGRLTLEGVVSSEMDKRLAFIAASGVPGAFSVTNNLRFEDAKSELGKVKTQLDAKRDDRMSLTLPVVSHT